MIQDNKPIRYQQYRSGRWEAIDRGVILEAPVSLTVNGEVWLTFMCTPTDLEFLAAGFLFNEGVIGSREEIASIRVCPTKDNIDVWLNHGADQPRQWKRTSGCTGGITSADETSLKPVIQNGAILSPDQIGALIDHLFEAQQLYREVGGVHTSMLSDGQTVWVLGEDIGRHNSLDKIAGRCLLEGIELGRKILVTTGRISSEMLQKSARLGAAIVVSRTSPSSLSIEMAERFGITLIGYARRDRFNLYTHPGRIRSLPGKEIVYAPKGPYTPTH
jgi:FdhD protein